MYGHGEKCPKPGMRGALKCKIGVGESSETCCVSEGLRTWHSKVSVEKSAVVFVLYRVGVKS